MIAGGLKFTQRGMALVVVLWGCMLLTVIATSFAFSIRSETTIAGNYLHHARAEAIAEAGIRRGIMALLMPSSESSWHPDGSINERTFGAGKLRVAITSESGKIDLNAAPELLIYGLLSQFVETGAGVTDDDARRFAKAIVKWRKPDHERQSSQAVEDGAGTRREGAFLTVSELTRIPGMTPDLVAAVSDSLTVYSHQPKIDAATAPRQVLLAIPGLDPARVHEFLAARATQFQTGAETNARTRFRLASQLLAPGAQYLSRTRASVYTIDAQGIGPDGVQARRQAVVQLTGDPKRPYLTLAWRDALYHSQLGVGIAVTPKEPESNLPAGG